MLRYSVQHDSVLRLRLRERQMALLHPELLQRHAEGTASTVAERILAAWPAEAARFVKVMPSDYKRVLSEMRRAQSEGRTVEFADLMRSAHG